MNELGLGVYKLCKHMRLRKYIFNICVEFHVLKLNLHLKQFFL